MTDSEPRPTREGHRAEWLVASLAAVFSAALSVALAWVIAARVGTAAGAPVSSEEGARRAALGVAVASLAQLLAGVLLGVWRRRADPLERRVTPTYAAPNPWRGVVLIAGLGAAWGGALLASGPEFVSPGALELGHAVALAHALAVPGLLLAGLGAGIGARTAPRFVPAVLLGAVVIALAQVAGAAVAEQLPFDADLANAALLAAAVGGFALAGCAVALVAQRMGFAELWCLALGFGYALFFSVALGGGDAVRASSVPAQQILLVLSVGPAAGALIFLCVGASVGFLLFGGGGRPDPGFGFELLTALRYLKLRVGPGLILTLVLTPVVVLALSGSVGLATALTVPLAAILLVLWFGLRGPSAPPPSERRSPFVGLTLMISVGGVCVGVMALIVVLSVMGGFEEDVKSKLLGAHAHVAVTKLGDDFAEYPDVGPKLRGIEGVTVAASFLLAEGMLSTDAGLAGSLVKGIDVSDESATRELLRNMERGELDHLRNPERIGGRRSVRLSDTSTSSAGTSTSTGRPRPLLEPIATITDTREARVLPGIVIGREMAHTLRAYVGDTVSLVSPASEELGPNGPQPKLRRFRVAGIFFSGMYEFDSKFSYVDLAQAQRFFGMRDRVTGIELRVRDVGETGRIVEEVKRRVGGYPYQVRDWREMNRELFSALLLEKIAMFIVLSFIVLVASFLIVSTLVMIVLEKAREIAILKSMGASDASIMKIFVVQGLFVGFGGATLGLVLGVGLCLFIERFGVNLDADIFYITQLPVVMDMGEIGAVLGSAVVITYLASIFPAIAAARTSPVDGLRED